MVFTYQYHAHREREEGKVSRLPTPCTTGGQQFRTGALGPPYPQAGTLSVSLRVAGRKRSGFMPQIYTPQCMTAHVYCLFDVNALRGSLQALWAETWAENPVSMKGKGTASRV